MSQESRPKLASPEDIQELNKAIKIINNSLGRDDSQGVELTRFEKKTSENKDTKSELDNKSLTTKSASSLGKISGQLTEVPKQNSNFTKEDVKKKWQEIYEFSLRNMLLIDKSDINPPLWFVYLKRQGADPKKISDPFVLRNAYLIKEEPLCGIFSSGDQRRLLVEALVVLSGKEEKPNRDECLRSIEQVANSNHKYKQLAIDLLQAIKRYKGGLAILNSSLINKAIETSSKKHPEFKLCFDSIKSSKTKLMGKDQRFLTAQGSADATDVKAPSVTRKQSR